MKLLLAKGADPKIKEKKGKTALDLAGENNGAAVIAILKESGK